MSYVFSVAKPISLPVVNETHARFPVQNIYCVGRNYADHAVEMGHDPDREEPFFFMKPAYAVLSDGGAMSYPTLSSDVHHEIELVVALQSGGQNIKVSEAAACIFGYAVGLDMTRRDLQVQAKSQSRPWDAGKSFLHSAPCSAVTPVSQCGDMESAAIQLDINGDIRQSGDVNQMIWKVNEVISRLSQLFVLMPGDLIFTGTPAGVGPIEVGDRLVAKIDRLAELEVCVQAS